MKKCLLLAGMAMITAGAIAGEALTEEQLAKFRIMVTNEASSNIFNKSNAVTLEYTDASNPTTISIENFDGNGLPLKVTVDWDTNKISAAPYTFSAEYDDETYQTYYLMVVSEEAANMSSPMDPAFSSSKVTGSISEGMVTLENWNMVKVNMYFSEMTKVYDQPMTTTIYLPNATISTELYDWDDDWENLVPSYTQEYPIYTEATATGLTVYNWDDQASCINFTLTDTEEGKVYATAADEIIYNDGKRQYGIYALAGTTWDDVSEQQENVFSSAVVSNVRELNFGEWIIYALNRHQERSFGKSAKITFDYDLPITITGVTNVASEAATATTYYTLDGRQIEKPSKGIYVKVEMTEGGVVRTSKAVF